MEAHCPSLPKKVQECARCGTLIYDGGGVNVNGKILCRACADGAYGTRSGS